MHILNTRSGGHQSFLLRNHYCDIMDDMKIRGTWSREHGTLAQCVQEIRSGLEGHAVRSIYQHAAILSQ